jgi:hypothetical protein
MNMRNEMINEGRIKKTKLFFEERDYFMNWIISEITTAKNKAEKLGYTFSVRLNNTSDISPEMFKLKIDGKEKNLMELFPDVTFYDYTKVPSRHLLLDKYKNYDLTFSYSGENLDECHTMLGKGVRIAVVFRKKLPETFWGREVIDGDLYDMRYHDKKDIIIGLKYKTTRTKVSEKSKFVVTI